MNNPSISVCIATFNGALFIEEQLRSVLIQLSINDEVIISDDSSTDDTIEIIKSINDPRIYILPKSSYKNPIFNFENAISAAKHEIIFLCDQDDIWLPNKVSETLKVFQDTHADLVLSDCKVVDEHLNIIHQSYRNLYNFKKSLFQIFFLNPYLGCCIAFKRRIFRKILPFPKFIPMHDIWIGSVCELFFKVVVYEKPLMLYRRHNSNATPYTATSRSKNSIAKKIGFRINMIRSLFLALFR
jgi:glycosyltransferase involved in cell wall biosynthesis